MDGLRTELSLAGEEIGALRAERDKLAKKVQLLLGGQLEQVPHDRLVTWPGCADFGLLEP